MSEQTNEVQNSQLQEKTTRKRRILMKEKCSYIDHQISLNLSKLDQLLDIIKCKKQQTGLTTIKEDEENDQNQDDLLQNQQTKKQIRKERRLKFKYSIFREYQFLENALTENQHKNMSFLKNQTSRKSSFEEQMLLSGFNQLHSQRSNYDQFLEDKKQTQGFNQSLKLVNMVSKTSFNNSQFIEMKDIQTIMVQTRYDWINKYLERQFHDTIVKGKSNEGKQIQILAFDPKQDKFSCKSLSTVNQNQSSQFQNHLYYNYTEFLTHNPQIQVSFPKHNHSIQIIHSQVQQVIKVDLQNKSHEIRLLVKSENQNSNNMQRIIIFKQLPTKNQDDQKYKIVWTRYGKDSFTEDVILQGGYDYLVTNLCCNPSSQVFLIFKFDDLENLKIQKSKYDPWKSYNILCSSFEQCSRVFMCQNVFDNSKPLEFLRSNFLDYGLVLQIYQNIYREKVAFVDRKQRAKDHQQDIDLLFPELYSLSQNQNIYQPDELVIKFFQVTQKPARLYFPQKKVLIGSKIAENVTIHSTFK